LFSFAPEGDRARAFDARMRLSLADSLAHIADQIRGHLPFDDAAFTAMVADMHAGARYPASTFGLYSEIVLALVDEGDAGLARAKIEELLLEKPLPGRWRVLPLDAPAHARHGALFARQLDSDPNTSFLIAPPAPGLAAAYGARLLRSFALMERAVPGLAAEFDALVSDVILVVGDLKAKYQFDGGSSYMLWGGLFLNATSHPDEVTMIEVMAHESAHLLLYACAADEALVENGDDELYRSPLRVDERPMDGIFHATFVSARMHWAMSRLLESGQLDDGARQQAETARASDAANFWSGHGVVAEHGRLTATGASVMAAAAAYMASVR
jgi:HEXXH motif-containing protein